MTGYLRNTLKVFILLLCCLLCVTGCSKGKAAEPDFKDITYALKLEDGDSSQNEEDENSQNTHQSEKNTNSNAKSNDTDKSTTNTDKTGNDDAQQVSDEVKTINIQKFSCVDSRLTASVFLPNIAYMEDGVAKDTMFESLAFMPNNNFVHDYSSDGALKAMTKKDWSSYIYNYEFKEGYNIDALEEAAGQVKEALEMPDYKVNVYLSLLPPVNTVEAWGEVDGRMLNFAKSDADRITGAKWLVDEQIKAFNERNYQNIKLCGFYYYHESISDNEAAVLPAITDYVRSVNMVTVWAPYYMAKGYDKWNTFGFDYAAMQSNYFPGRPNLPNGGGPERVSATALITKARGMGTEMELPSHSLAESIGGMKLYLKTAIETETMNGFHTWWIANGLSSVKYLYKSSDPYIHSLYKEIYLFLKGNLEVSDITNP